MKTWLLHVCDVCSALDADHGEKECFYCDKCDAWICEADALRFDRRARAMVLRRVNPNGSNTIIGT